MIDKFLNLYNEHRRKQVTNEEAAQQLGISTIEWETARMLINTTTLSETRRYIETRAIPQTNTQKKQP